jgi:hypothetical protein
VIFNLPALILSIVSIPAAGGYIGSQPYMTELQRFIYYQEPDETDRWVHWQQRGSFAGREDETRIGHGLLLYREELQRTVAGEMGQLSASDFDARFGPQEHPNFCAISKQAIAATFAVNYGGSPDDYDVWKFSRCTP